jgi:FkbM family methyltransferase
MFKWRYLIQAWLRKRGYEVVHYPIMHFLSHYGINLVLDVGANKGQFAQELRRLGYRGRMVSFEPLSSAYDHLVKNAARDPLWKTANFALGPREAKMELQIAGNSASSSFLEMLPEYPEITPGLSSVGRETVSVKRLDSLFSDYCAPGDRIFLKIDAQGYEKRILEGALGVIDQVTGLGLEMSLVPIYEGESLLEELISFAREHGFDPIWISHGYVHPTTEHLLQVDGIFVQRSAHSRPFA